MRFTANRNELAVAAAAVAQGLPAHPRDPSHLGMLIYAAGKEVVQFNDSPDVVQLTASDGDTTFNATIRPEVAEPGSAVFPRIFPDVVKSLTGETVEVSAEDGEGTITCGKAKFTFRVQDGAKYPFPLLDVPEYGQMNGDDFRNALKMVLPASSKDNPVPALTAVMIQINLDYLSLVATDKYALAASECAFDVADCDHEGKAALLPARWAERIARMEGEHMKIGWDDGRVQVRSGGFTITCRQVDGEFPNGWEKMLLREADWTYLPEGLADAVRRASLTLGDKEPVILGFGDQLTVSSQGSKGGFTEVLPLQYGRQPVVLRVGSRMLLDALAWCDQAAVGRPLLLRGENVRYLVQVRRGDD